MLYCSCVPYLIINIINKALSRNILFLACVSCCCQGFSAAHDVAVTTSGDSVYVVTLAPATIYRLQRPDYPLAPLYPQPAGLETGGDVLDYYWPDDISEDVLTELALENILYSALEGAGGGGQEALLGPGGGGWGQETHQELPEEHLEAPEEQELPEDQEEAEAELEEEVGGLPGEDEDPNHLLQKKEHDDNNNKMKENGHDDDNNMQDKRSAEVVDSIM